MGVAAPATVTAQDIEKRLTLQSELTMVWADFSSDGRRIATANGSNSDGTAARLQVWDAETGQVLKVLEGHSLAVTRGDFHPNNPNLLATVSWDGHAILWNLDSGRPVWKKEVANTKVANVAFSRDGTVLAVSSATGVVKLLNPDNGETVREIRPHGTNTVNGMAFFPDGKRLATAGVDKTVQVTSLDTNEQDRQWRIETPFAFDVAVSRDGRRVAAPSQFQGITIWDVATGEKEHDFSVEGPFAFSVVFSPDGKWLAAGSGEPDEHGEIKIWDVESGDVVHTVTGHSGAAMFVRFDPQGQQLISASEDGSAIVWRVAPTKPSTTTKTPAKTASRADFPFGVLIGKTKGPGMTGFVDAV